MRFAWLIAAAALASCGTDPFTGVDVSIDADGCVAVQARRIVIRVFDAAGELRDMLEDDPVAFPTGVRVTPIDPDRTWRVTADAFDEAGMPIGALTVTGGWTEATLTTHQATLEDVFVSLTGRMLRDG